MPLLDIRKQFVKLSGRYDLIKDTNTWEDNGANWFINAGQKYLDRMLDNFKSYARFYTTLEADMPNVFIPTCRVVRKVWINTADQRIPLTEAFIEDLRLGFDGTQTGLPSYYALMTSRLLPTSDLNYVAGTFADASFSNEEYTAMFFGMKADQTYAVEVHGLFYSPKLDNDEAQSYWTETQDDILIQASLMRLEGFYRNFEGVKDSKAMVDALVAQIDMDSVAQEIANLYQIGG